MAAFQLFAAAATGDHGSQTAFYVAGAVLAAWAVVVGAVGILRPAFADGDGVGRAVIGTTAVLVAATVATAISTAS